MRLRADVLNVVILATFFVTALMPPAGALFWAWWRSPVGKAFFSTDILIAAAVLPGALARLFGIPVTGAGFQWFAIVMIGLIPPNALWRLRQIWMIQHQDGTHR